MTINRSIKQLLLCLARVCILAPKAIADKQLKVGLYQNNPGVFMNERGRATGFFITLLEEIATKEG